jgi:hypothetical protein
MTDTTMIWQVGLTSAAISAVISGIVLGVFNLLVKRNEYVNDYHKIVIQRRIAVYENLEKLIFLIKSVMVDHDGRPYHVIFSADDPQQAFYTLLIEITAGSLWLGNKAFEILRRLNIRMFDLPSDKAQAIEFGKNHHQEIASIREELENALAEDIRTLYKVKRFLKSKKSAPAGFRSVLLEHPPESGSAGD